MAHRRRNPVHTNIITSFIILISSVVHSPRAPACAACPLNLLFPLRFFAPHPHLSILTRKSVTHHYTQLLSGGNEINKIIKTTTSSFGAKHSGQCGRGVVVQTIMPIALASAQEVCV
ncbi:Hypothetical predicted protein [Scomber scombrus]|uniref:Secreted protein n=1 Tax=Scomber scombrus TaxID=13677 RepID=A0AAV1N1P8_SCOSC